MAPGSDRDKALVAIVQRAIQQNEYPVSIAAASDITFASTRDDALKEVACHALYRSNNRGGS